MADRNNIIDKVQALLSKTVKQGATEEEAASALAMAQKLLAKHNLSMTEVEVASKEASEIVQDMVMAKTEGSMQWIVQLASAISEVTYTRVLRGSAYDYKVPIYFVGRKYNAEAAKEMFGWVAPQINGMAKKLRSQKGESWRWYSSCALGMAVRVRNRLASAHREVLAQEVKLQALVVSYEDENKEYMEHFGMARTLSGELDHQGYSVGVDKGDSVSITPGSKQIE